MKRMIIKTFTDDRTEPHHTPVLLSDNQVAAYKQWKKDRRQMGDDLGMLCDFLGVDTPDQAKAYAQSKPMVMSATAGR